MNGQQVFLTSLAAALLGLAASPFALAQIPSTPPPLVAPSYDSGVAAGPLSDRNFNTPEADGRPGVKYFAYAVQAYRKGDFRHAVDMYKVAASWAYKPAEYNLGVMYFKGEGVPVNRALGAAWMVLAAERGDPLYVQTRDRMVTVLTDAEFAQTDRYWATLRKTYGDKVALRRAKAQWALAKSRKTGSRVGGVAGELHLGVLVGPAMGGQQEFAATGWGYLTGGSVGGAVAYRQFQQSDDPYSPIFLKHRKGSATVGPLQEVSPRKPGRPPKSGSDKHKP